MDEKDYQPNCIWNFMEILSKKELRCKVRAISSQINAILRYIRIYRRYYFRSFFSFLSLSIILMYTIYAVDVTLIQFSFDRGMQRSWSHVFLFELENLLNFVSLVFIAKSREAFRNGRKCGEKISEMGYRGELLNATSVSNIPVPNLFPE